MTTRPARRATIALVVVFLTAAAFGKSASEVVAVEAGNDKNKLVRNRKVSGQHVVDANDMIREALNLEEEIDIFEAITNFWRGATGATVVRDIVTVKMFHLDTNQLYKADKILSGMIPNGKTVPQQNVVTKFLTGWKPYEAPEPEPGVEYRDVCEEKRKGPITQASEESPCVGQLDVNEFGDLRMEMSTSIYQTKGGQPQTNNQISYTSEEQGKISIETKYPRRVCASLKAGYGEYELMYVQFKHNVVVTSAHNKKTLKGWPSNEVASYWLDKSSGDALESASVEVKKILAKHQKFVTLECDDEQLKMYLLWMTGKNEYIFGSKKAIETIGSNYEQIMSMPDLIRNDKLELVMKAWSNAEDGAKEQLTNIATMVGSYLGWGTKNLAKGVFVAAATPLMATGILLWLFLGGPFLMGK